MRENLHESSWLFNCIDGCIFLGVFATVGICLNVTSMREFSDKMVEIGPDAIGGPNTSVNRKASETFQKVDGR